MAIVSVSVAKDVKSDLLEMIAVAIPMPIAVAMIMTIVFAVWLLLIKKRK